MVTKISLRQEAARLAVDIIINSEEQQEFLPLAKEIYDFFLSDLDIPDKEDVSEIMKEYSPLLTKCFQNTPCHEETSENKTQED